MAPKTKATAKSKEELERELSVANRELQNVSYWRDELRAKCDRVVKKNAALETEVEGLKAAVAALTEENEALRERLHGDAVAAARAMSDNDFQAALGLAFGKTLTPWGPMPIQLDYHGRVGYSYERDRSDGSKSQNSVRARCRRAVIAELVRRGIIAPVDPTLDVPAPDRTQEIIEAVWTAWDEATADAEVSDGCMKIKVVDTRVKLATALDSFK